MKIKSQVSSPWLALCFLFSFSLFFLGCRQDMLKFDPSVSTPHVVSASPLTAEMAKAWFESQFGPSKTVAPPTSRTASFTSDSTTGGSYFNQTFQITPAWDQAKISTYLAVHPIVVVPVEPIAFLDAENQDYALIVFRDSTNQISAKLQAYSVYSQYKQTHPDGYNVNDFSGLFYQILLDGKLERVLEFQNGQATVKVDLLPDENLRRNTATSRSVCSRCNNNNPVGLDALVCAICGLGKMFAGGGGGGGNITPVYTPPVPLYYGDDFYRGGYISGGGNNSGGGGGTSSGTLEGQLDNSYFQTLQLAQIRTEFEAHDLLDFFNELRLGPLLVLRNVHKFLKIKNFDIATVICLRQYLDEGVTFDDFEDFFRNSQNFSLINDFLVEYNFSADAKKIAKVHSYAFKNDADYASETLLEGKIPVPLAAWILKASGETIIDLGIDVVFGYLTGEPPGFWNAALTFGSNLIGTGELTQAGKIAKYTAKITELTERVKLLRGGVAVAQNIKTKADRLLVILREASVLDNPSTYLNKVKTALDDVIGALYEARIATAIGNVVKGVGLRNQDLADNIGLSLAQLTDFAARKGFNHVNDVEIDILEDLGGGLLSLTETKTAEGLNSRFFGQFDKFVDLALERFNLTQQNTIVTYYFRHLTDAEKNILISRGAQKGVTVRVFIQQ